MSRTIESEKLEQRVRELESERRAGQQMLAELETRRTNLSHTLMRIDGAIEVLRELLATEPAAAPGLDGRLELVGSEVAGRSG